MSVLSFQQTNSISTAQAWQHVLKICKAKWIHIYPLKISSGLTIPLQSMKSHNTIAPSRSKLMKDELFVKIISF